MQEDRSSNVEGNVSGREAVSDAAPERREMTERERELAAKSLRAREEENDARPERHRSPLTSGG